MQERRWARRREIMPVRKRARGGCRQGMAEAVQHLSSGMSTNQCRPHPPLLPGNDVMQGFNNHQRCACVCETRWGSVSEVCHCVCVFMCVSLRSLCVCIHMYVLCESAACQCGVSMCECEPALYTRTRHFCGKSDSNCPWVTGQTVERSTAEAHYF